MKKPNKLPPVELLNKLFDYDPCNGLLISKQTNRLRSIKAVQLIYLSMIAFWINFKDKFIFWDVILSSTVFCTITSKIMLTFKWVYCKQT